MKLFAIKKCFVSESAAEVDRMLFGASYTMEFELLSASTEGLHEIFAGGAEVHAVAKQGNLVAD